MDENILLSSLEDLAKKLSIKVIKDKHLYNKGGFCRYNTQYYLVIKNKIPRKEKIRLFTRAISKVLPEDYYVLPAIRELIDKERLKGERA